MKEKYPIKTDLFRFVTLRTPNQLNQNIVSGSFIQHPDIAQSKISSCPLPRTNDNIFREYLQSFLPVSGYKDIRAINPSLYDFSSQLFRNRTQLPDLSPEQIRKYRLTQEQLIWVWDQLLFQVIARSSSYVRQAAIQMIFADNIVKHWEERETEAFRQYLNAKVVIPQEVITWLRSWLYNECAGDMKGVNNLGIADFRKVEQEVCCYVPSEVSHIENILAREYKEKSTRNLVRTEQTIEITNEREIENLTDITTATRNEISTEIASVIDEGRSSNYGGSLGVSAKIFGAQVDVNAYADFANANSSSVSNSTAKNYAEEVTKRALERIVQRTIERRTSTVIKEFEENNKHGFDNRKGDKHVTGIYRWVDIIYKNRLINYGKRLMFEFMVPEPAEFYKRARNYKSAKETNTTAPAPEKPKPLSDFKINSADDLLRVDYTEAAGYYGVTIPAPQSSSYVIAKAFAPTPPIKHDNTAWVQVDNQTFTIPADYEATSVKASYSFDYRSTWPNPESYFRINVNGAVRSHDNLRSSSRKTVPGTIPLTNFTTPAVGFVPVTFSGRRLFVYGANIEITCKLKTSVQQAWASNAYTLLSQGYQRMLDEYQNIIDQQNALAEAETGSAGEENNANPAFNRIVEQRELKRACIEMITKPFCRKQGEKFYDDITSCEGIEIPKIRQNAAFEEYTSQVKFFEQAFEWDLISYLFYPYYWADKCDWADLFQSENPDAVFQAFLQAGMARVVVPVRPQFMEAVLYYMETGDIWLGGDLVPGTDNDLYLSLAEEMEEVDGWVEEEWETRVPTTLAIVQDKSAKLMEEGLPCCHEVENDDTTTNIKESDEILGNILPEPGE